MDLYAAPSCTLSDEAKTSLNTKTAFVEAKVKCSESGKKKFSVYASDNAGGKKTGYLSVTITNTSPAAKDNGSTTSGYKNENIPIQGKCTDSDGTVSSCEFSLSNAKDCSLGTQQKSGAATQTMTVGTSLKCSSTGTKKLVLTAIDNKGDTKTAAISILVKEQMTSTTNPSVKPKAQDNGSKTTGKLNSNLTLKGKCSSSTQKITNCHFTPVSGSCSISDWTYSGLSTSTAYTQATAKCTSTGQKTVMLTAKDDAGNQTQATITFTINN
ncbi:hypothetical protein HZB89_01450 [archaeon]|nr:hypothetical protein [archaeon]